VCAQFEDLCKSVDVHLVYVGVPPSRHCDIVLKALQCGKHVLCEKPLALSDEETASMVDAAAKSTYMGYSEAKHWGGGVKAALCSSAVARYVGSFLFS